MARSLNDRSNSSGMIDGQVGANFAQQLVALENDRAAIYDDIKKIYREAKAAGFPGQHMRQYVKDQRKDPNELQAWRDYQQSLEAALGPFMQTPLGAAAMRVVPLEAPRRRGRPKTDYLAEMKRAAELAEMKQTTETRDYDPDGAA